MPDTISHLKTLLKDEDTAERCGIILKNGEVIEVENKHHDPEKGFVISSRVFHDHEHEIAATWHTHPNASANLSHEDYNGFRQWPELTHYIIGVDGVRAFEVLGELVVEIDL